MAARHLQVTSLWIATAAHLPQHTYRSTPTAAHLPQHTYRSTPTAAHLSQHCPQAGVPCVFPSDDTNSQGVRW
ncbi:hypothetical protein C8Q78DRAFT_757145 [Trametes maxima]|nr:hypothetical protein C8Q78DRAFT_757145 [Trametes maxima]